MLLLSFLELLFHQSVSFVVIFQGTALFPLQVPTIVMTIIILKISLYDSIFLKCVNTDFNADLLGSLASRLV